MQTTPPNPPEKGSPLGQRPADQDTTEELPRRQSMSSSNLSIEGYQFVRKLSEGNQGVVYQAIQKDTGRKVAIKIPLHGAHQNESRRARFEREMMILGQLKHPHIVAIFHSGRTAENVPYYVMDYIRGLPLNEYIREHKPSLETVIRMFRIICDAIEHAHSHNIVHRDIKPSNILVDVEGNPKILDFGLAKLLNAPIETVVTSSEDVIGTLRYMSPEHARGTPELIDPRSDVYSVGVMLYEALTGRSPYPEAFRSHDILKYMTDMIQHILETPPEPPVRAWQPESGVGSGLGSSSKTRKCPIDRDIETILLSALAKDPSRRYQSAAEFSRNLSRYLAGEPVDPRSESMSYRLRVRAAKHVRRHPFLVSCLIVVIAGLTARFAVLPFICAATEWPRTFQTFLQKYVVQEDRGATFQCVRVISLTSQTDIEAIAQNEGLIGVTSDLIPSFRALHGRLVRKLLSSGCKAVAFDVRFVGNQPDFDGELLSAMEEAHRHGVHVIVASEGWPRNENELARRGLIVSSPFARFGGISASPGQDGTVVALAVQRGQAVLPSLALKALASLIRPTSECYPLLDQDRETLQIVFTDKELGAHSFYVPVTSVRKKGADEVGNSGDIIAGDIVADLLLERFPSDPVLHSITVDYGEVFEANVDTLKEWFKDRIALVGNFRSDDRHKVPDGRLIQGTYFHAVAIDALQREAAPIAPRLVGEFIAPFAGAVVGIIAARAGARQRLVGFTTLAVLILFLLLVSYVAYRYCAYILDPMWAFVGLLASYLLGLAVFALLPRNNAATTA